MQPIVLYHAPSGSGPNPWKVAFILAELQIPFEIKWTKYLDLRREPYLSINPNGKVPSIEDPNTGVTVFESGACIQYIIETRITTPRQRYKRRLFFRCSGQGPYFGQKMWFSNFHSEKNIVSAIERYAFEAKGIIGVLESKLAKQKQGGSDWLVGDKCRYADLAFVSWNNLIPAMFPEGFEVEEEFPLFYGWWQSMLGMESVRGVLEMKAEAGGTLMDSADEARHAR
ncbi:hypothetical protein K402DRAFT_412262 [Aulographum hederae CBS 113979]|uniref:Glutathione S-transferase n=1 Tax=Aulographum hederae CBS 113979 TaxID=1176131 RepID=A0A6G1H252_9PEZI|nr:hypothetical protein K402DRAFT_412262 [Aulographum hederae CBS 113979]